MPVLNAVSDWILRHAELIGAYALIIYLVLWMISHPHEIYQALRRKAAEEIKALVDLWTPVFDLLAVVLPKIFDSVVARLTEIHYELRRPEQYRTSEPKRKNYYHLLGTQ